MVAVGAQIIEYGGRVRRLVVFLVFFLVFVLRFLVSIVVFGRGGLRRC